jgi:diaminopimelate epimerase
VKKISFYKYHGTGNDFVMIDDRNHHFPRNNHELVAQICERRFGVGADGLILLDNHSTEDFEMIYYNADGHLGSFCGNGGRCVVAFAKQLGIVHEQTQFMAADGLHRAKINNGQVSLNMNEVNQWKIDHDFIFMDTGSPHHVIFKEDVSSVDVAKEGSEIAHNEQYGVAGTNVNFVSLRNPHQIDVRTFERGVEAETFSCGTGVTASAIAAFLADRTDQTQLKVHTLGGVLEVNFKPQENRFNEIVLEGPARMMFSGTIEF